jgi:pantetheine-phosphate adenylyltransferase
MGMFILVFLVRNYRIMNSKIALFPGSFDPFTKGHESVVLKSLQLFEKVIIAIGVNASKNYYSELDKRKSQIQSLFEAAGDRVSIVTYSSLTVDLCKALGAHYIVRGLRNSNDFEYEYSIAQMNQSMSGIETVFFTTEPQFSPINATIVREIYKNKGDISHFVTNSHLLV